jgi:hypothetical protein
MLLKNLTEKYEPDHKCKTPGAIYTITIHDDEISAKVKLPKGITIPSKGAADLESDFHYAVEKVLAKYFN